MKEEMLEMLEVGEENKGGRYLMNRWLFKILSSAVTPIGGDVLEIGTGGSTTGMAMYGRGDYHFVPTDVHVGDKYPYTLPEVVQFDVLNPACDLIKTFPQWDLILCNQVLEHLPEVRLAVRNMYNLLKVGGVLVITTPFMYRIHETDPGTGIVEEDMKDYWRFTPSGLDLILSNSGFTEYSVGKVCNRPDAMMNPEICMAIARRTPTDEKQPFQWTPTLPGDWYETLQAWDYEYRERVGMLKL